MAASSLSIDGILNSIVSTFPVSNTNYLQLVNWIDCASVVELNQIIYVELGDTIEVTNAKAPPLLRTGIIKRNYVLSKPGCTFTSTLTNIIATNELNLTTQQMCQVLYLLLRKRVDVSIIDNTPYRNNPQIASDHCGNNVLKHLVVAAKGCEQIRKLISVLLSYVAEQPNTHLIIDAVDNYLFGKMSSAALLLRIGYEDLALQLYRMGASVGELDFMFACASFGTTKYYTEAASCIKHMLETVELSSYQLQQGVEQLTLGSQGYMQKKRTSLVSVSLEKEGFIYHRAKSFYENSINEKKISSYDEFIKCCHPDHLTEEQRVILNKLVIATYFDGEDLGKQHFSKYYRDRNIQDLLTAKMNRLHREAKAHFDYLIRVIANPMIINNECLIADYSENDCDNELDGEFAQTKCSNPYVSLIEALSSYKKQRKTEPPYHYTFLGGGLGVCRAAKIKAVDDFICVLKEEADPYILSLNLSIYRNGRLAHQIRECLDNMNIFDRNQKPIKSIRHFFNHLAQEAKHKVIVY